MLKRPIQICRPGAWKPPKNAPFRKPRFRVLSRSSLPIALLRGQWGEALSQYTITHGLGAYFSTGKANMCGKGRYSSVAYIDD